MYDIAETNWKIHLESGKDCNMIDNVEFPSFWNKYYRE